jgi:hypothetical protein
MAYVVGQLPPIGQARELFNHFAPNFTLRILHIPSTCALMEQTYQNMLEGEDPSITNLLVLFGIFAGAAFLSTPQLLEKLNCRQAETEAAFSAYNRMAMFILDNAHQPVTPSTNALAAITNVAHLLGISGGVSVKLHVQRIRCLSMARAMGVHRLDTAKSREERRLKGCNMIEIEVQRRVWWHLVSTDW